MEYKAMLLDLTGRGSSYRLECCMETIRCMFNSEQCSGFFTENDYDNVVETGLSQLNVPNKPVARVQTMKTMSAFLSNKEYLKYFPHRIKDIQACMDTQVLDEDAETAYTQAEKKMITTLNFQLQVLQD